MGPPLIHALVIQMERVDCETERDAFPRAPQHLRESKFYPRDTSLYSRGCDFQGSNPGSNKHEFATHGISSTRYAVLGVL